MNRNPLNEPPMRLEFELENWQEAGEIWRARLIKNGNVVASEPIDYGHELPKIKALFEAAGIPVVTRERGGIERPRHLRERAGI